MRPPTIKPRAASTALTCSPWKLSSMSSSSAAFVNCRGSSPSISCRHQSEAGACAGVKTLGREALQPAPAHIPDQGPDLHTAGISIETALRVN